MIEQELGARISVLFGSFDDEPLAAGSVAQVHAPPLRDGRPVVVKVQRPGIAQTLREDLSILEKLAGAADRLTEMGRRYGFVEWVQELRHSLAREIDFELEADNLRRFASNLQDYQAALRAAAGQRLHHRTRTDHGPRAGHQGHPRAAGARGWSTRCACQASELMRAYLDQVFVHGLVHADPHPGNVLLMDDQRLALFDLGMVARLTPRTRRSLLKLLLGAIGGNADQVGEISEAHGHRAGGLPARRIPPPYRPAGRPATSALQDAKQGFLRRPAGTGAGARERGVRAAPPPEMGVLGKTLLNLEAVTTALDPDLDVRSVVQEHLQQVMRQQAISSMSPANLASEWLDMQELVRHTPQHMAAILRTLAENRLRVRIDGLEESRMMESMQKIANRVATGVIVAALVVGAALTARMEDGGRRSACRTCR